MRLDKWSQQADTFARHKAKQFVKVFKLPSRANRHGLNGLFIGQSLFFRTDEYDKAFLSDLVRTVARYNANYSVQFCCSKRQPITKSPASLNVGIIQRKDAA